MICNCDFPIQHLNYEQLEFTKQTLKLTAESCTSTTIRNRSTSLTLHSAGSRILPLRTVLASCLPVPGLELVLQTRLTWCHTFAALTKRSSSAYREHCTCVPVPWGRDSIHWNIWRIPWVWGCLMISTLCLNFLRGGGSGLSFWKNRFRVRSWRGRPGHVPTFWV